MFESDDKDSIFGSSSIFDKTENNNGGSIFEGSSPYSSNEPTSVFDRAANKLESAFGGQEDLASKYSSGSQPSGIFDGPTERSDLFSGPMEREDFDLSSQYMNGPVFEREEINLGYDGPSFDRQEIDPVSSHQNHLDLSRQDLSPIGSYEENDYEHRLYRVEAQDMGITDMDKYRASYMVEGAASGVAMLNFRGARHGQMNLLDRMRGIEANHLDIDGDSVSLAESYSDKTLDKRVMNGAYNVTLSDIYTDKTMYMAHHGLITDGIIKIKEKTYMAPGSSDPEHTPFNSHSIYAEGPDVSSAKNESIFSQRRDRSEDKNSFSEGVSSLATTPGVGSMAIAAAASIFAASENQASGEDPREAFRNMPLDERLKMIREGKVPDEVPPGEIAKTLKEEKDLQEKEQRLEKKQLEKEEKEKAKQLKRDMENSKYEEILRQQNCREVDGGCSVYSKNTNSQNSPADTPSVVDVILAANSAKNQASKEEVDERTFSMMTTQEQARMIQENRAPATLSQAEKDRILRSLKDLEEQLGTADQKRENVFTGTLDEAIDRSVDQKEKEKKSMFERAAKKLSEAEFKYLSDEEKLKAFERGETPDDLDQITIHELKEKLKKEQEKRRLAGGLAFSKREKHSLIQEDAEEIFGKGSSIGSGDKSKIKEFENMPLEERLKLIRSGKIPEGIPPALIAKTLKEEKDSIEKERREEKRAEAKAQKELEKAAKRELKNKEIIEALQAANMKNISDESRINRQNEKLGLSKDDEAEIVKKLKDLSKRGSFPISDNKEDDEAVIVSAIKKINEGDQILDPSMDEEGEFEHFQKMGRPEQEIKKQGKNPEEKHHEFFQQKQDKLDATDMPTDSESDEALKILSDKEELARRLKEFHESGKFPLEDEAIGEEEKVLDDSLIGDNDLPLDDELANLQVGSMEAPPTIKPVSIKDIEVLRKKRKKKTDDEDPNEKGSNPPEFTEEKLEVKSAITIEEIASFCLKNN